LKKSIQVTFRSIRGHRKWARFLLVHSSDHSSKVLRSSAWAGQTDRQTDRQCRCDKPIRVFCRRCVVRIPQASTPGGGRGHIPRIYYAGIYPYGNPQYLTLNSNLCSLSHGTWSRWMGMKVLGLIINLKKVCRQVSVWTRWGAYCQGSI